MGYRLPENRVKLKFLFDERDRMEHRCVRPFTHLKANLRERTIRQFFGQVDRQMTCIANLAGTIGREECFLGHTVMFCDSTDDISDGDLTRLDSDDMTYHLFCQFDIYLPVCECRVRQEGG